MSFIERLSSLWKIKCTSIIVKGPQSVRYQRFYYILPVDRVGEVRVLLELLGEDTLLGKGTADGEGVPHGCPLRLSPESQQLPHIVDQPCQLEPVWGRGERERGRERERGEEREEREREREREREGGGRGDIIMLIMLL